MNKLISIAEHSDWLDKSPYMNNRKWEIHRQRVEFGKQPLEIWMFVPCKLVDGVWVVLEEPKHYKNWEKALHPKPATLRLKSYMDYQQAKERCLFEGITEIESDYIISSSDNNTIEDITAYNFTLTASAQKQLEL